LEELREGKVVGRKGRALRIECPACGDIVRGRGTDRGRSMKCPTCYSKFLIPGPPRRPARKKKYRLLPKVPVVRAEKFFHCFWCKEPIEYTALRCPHCKEQQRLKLEPMRWIWIGASLAAIVLGYFAFSYGVIGRTLMERAFGVVVVDRYCRKIGVLRGLGRAVVLVLFLIPLLAGPVLSALSASSIAAGISMHDKVFGTYQLRKDSLHIFLSLAEERRAEYEGSQLA
jgi:DNA-directed RNA polymerase subunit RPC12/RpoP